ncbi:MAG: hypothetical protein ACTSWL_02820 [Promethearchaeota archaeon]
MQPRGKVKLNLEIYKTVIATTVRYANARIPEDDWAEVYGLLYGYNDGDDVIVTEAIPFTHTKKKRHILKVEFDEEDYALAAAIESDFYTRDPPQYIVGWYHSHPGIKLMLSQDDIKNQLAWQTNNPLAIALVFNHVRLVKQYEAPARKGDPLKQLELDTGFKVFRLNDPNNGLQASFHEIPFEFTDFQIDDNFINNSKDFVQWVSKAFPKGEGVVKEYKKFVDNTILKMDEIYQGTESYINTLIRKGESWRIKNVVNTQKEEAKKILDKGNTMVSIFKMMKEYLEYKERERMLPQIEEILDQWSQQTSGFLNKFDNLPNTANIA